MAKPNYQFEKRQRELKKIKQQEEKRQKKLAGNVSAAPADEPELAMYGTTKPESAT